MFEGFFAPAQVKEFRSLIDRAYARIRKQEFEKAVLLYMDIHHAFETMPEEYQQKFEQDVDVLFKELTLYMRINEAYILAKEGSMAAFRHELDRIHDLTFELEPEVSKHRDLAILLEFTKKNYDFFLDVYSYKANVKGFQKKMRHVKILLQRKKMHKALKEYAELLIVYNKIAYILGYAKRFEFYETLKMLFKHLSIQRLLALAIEKPKSLRVKVELPPIVQEHFVHEPVIPNYAEVDPRYDALHALVKKGELKKAFDVYTKITKERLKVETPQPVRTIAAPPKIKMKRKHRTLLDQEYREKFEADYKKLHHLVQKGDFRTAKKLLKALK